MVYALFAGNLAAFTMNVWAITHVADHTWNLIAGGVNLLGVVILFGPLGRRLRRKD